MPKKLPNNVKQTPVNIAVVGHANTGKTSLIRTLLRDSEFGEIADYAGTTRHVEAVSIRVENIDVIRLFDTPGIEDSIAFLELWQSIKPSKDLQSFPEKFRYFIELAEKDISFEQEVKVLKQAYQSDLLLYVIDARLPYLGKFQDELELLKLLGKPLIPVLNFIQDDSGNVALWRQQLQQANLHAVVEYDTVAFTLEAERRLYHKMQSLLESRYEQFASVLQQSEERFTSRIQSGIYSIADLIIDAATYRQEISQSTEKNTIEKMQTQLRSREELCVQELLQSFGFAGDDVNSEFLPIQNGRWERDLFDPQTLKDFGVKTTSNAAKGAVLGGGIDLMVGGITLGAAAALGAAAGAIWGVANRYGKAIWETVSGVRYACIDDITIELLYLRQYYLLHCLAHRGHATQEPLELDQSTHLSSNHHFKDWLSHLRRHPRWCNINRSESELFQRSNSDRETFLQNIQKQVDSQLQENINGS